MDVKSWISGPAAALIAEVPIESAVRHLGKEGAAHLVVDRRGRSRGGGGEAVVRFRGRGGA